MRNFVLKTGEVAYVPTDSEKQIIRIALEQFKNSLPLLEGADA